MRGPRVRANEASLPLELADGSADLLGSLAGIASEVVAPPFVDVEAGERLRPGRLRGRTLSPST